MYSAAVNRLGFGSAIARDASQVSQQILRGGKKTGGGVTKATGAQSWPPDCTQISVGWKMCMCVCDTETLLVAY